MFIPLINNAQIIETDTYPVTNKMLAKAATPKHFGAAHTLDQAWFTNDTLKETLVFELYTDYHRFVTYHFFNDQIPSYLLKGLTIYSNQGNSSYGPISDSLKAIYAPKFIDSATRISANYFLSNLKHKLGESANYAIQKYGEPDTNFKNGAFTVLKWDIVGEITMIEEEIKSIKYAKDSFGLRITMIYNNNCLVGRIIFNDIP